MSDTTFLTSATELEKLLREVADGKWASHDELAELADRCQGWKTTFPEQFAGEYDRFETARLAVQQAPSDESWEELRESAMWLANAFEAAIS